MFSRRAKKLLILALSGMLAFILGMPALAFLGWPLLRPSPKPIYVRLARIEDLRTGEPVLMPLRMLQGRPEIIRRTLTVAQFWLVRRSVDDVEVFPNRCTQSGCPLEYDREMGRFVCECHRDRLQRSLDVEPTPSGKPQTPKSDLLAAFCRVKPLPRDWVRSGANGWIEVRHPVPILAKPSCSSND